MSTPTTAVALPHYHHNHAHGHAHRYHHPPYSPYQHHNQHPQSQPAHHQNHHPSSSATVASTTPTTSSNTIVNTNTRSVAANSLLHHHHSQHQPSLPSPSSSSNPPRLLPPTLYPPSPATTGYSTVTDGVTQPRHHQNHQNHLHQQPQSPGPVPPPHAGHNHSHYSSSSSHHVHQNAGSSSSSSRLAIDDGYPSSTMATTGTTTIAASNGVHFDDPADDLPSRKRRRSREPDWNNFYRNGLPKEIIVIDDSPDPEANTGRKLANTGPAPAYEASPAARQPAKKRRRDDAPPAGYHVQYLSHTNTPNGGTHSSDRTNSALNTTAPTSLSSNGQYEEPALPLKRKRTTRQQTANDAKRRDVDGLGSQFLTYKPPPYPPKKVPEVPVRVIRDDHHNKNVKVDDDEGHFIVVPDAHLTENYQINRLLGQGTFGKVVQARDRKRNRAVAIKIIRSVQKYRDASRIELRVLATLKANDNENRNRCIHLRDTFDYRGHICIVMDLLGQSVFDFLKGNGFVPFPNSQIQNFARQLFTSVAFLHDLNLIHTDLKPENILLRSDQYQTFTYNRKIPSSSTNTSRSATQRRVLLDTEIRLIDFGSATFQDEYHSSVVSTRHYRAPEIILGLGWSYPCDIWSIGCILVEFYTGDALFQTHDNLEHLAMMEAVVGTRIDPHLVHSVNKMSTRSGGNAASKYFKRLKLDYPQPSTLRGSRRFVKAMKHLRDIIPSNNTFFKHFLDLLSKIFVYDPAQRITAKQALNHPWFREIANPDDGTEAAKIRIENEEKARQAQYVG